MTLLRILIPIACHPERSEGSLRPSSQTLRCAQGDMMPFITSIVILSAAKDLCFHAKYAVRHPHWHHDEQEP